MSGKASPKFDGMTLNERLFESRRMDAWDAAVAAGDRRELLSILRAVEVAHPDRIVGAVLRKRAF